MDIPTNIYNRINYRKMRETNDPLYYDDGLSKAKSWMKHPPLGE